MADPIVWADAKARIAAAAAALSLPIAWPNEQAPPEAAAYLRPEITASGAAPIELGGGIWREDGLVWLHLLVPTGGGFDAPNALRHRLGLAFRGVRPAVEGLEYTEISSAPEDFDESGNWLRLSCAVSYRLQTILETTP